MALGGGRAKIQTSPSPNLTTHAYASTPKLQRTLTDTQ